MKHLFMCATMLGCGLMAGAQILNVASIEKINTQLPVDQAVISPDGKSVVASSMSDLTLSRIALSDGKTEKVADNGTIYQLKFSSDSRSIVYVSESTNAQHLRFKEVRALNMDTRADEQLLAPTRTFNGVVMNGDNAMVMNDSRMSVRNLKGKKAETAPVAYTYYGELMLNVNGETIALNPQGKEGQSYLWPSVSPDGKKVSYYLGANGAFVCDIDGSNVTYIGDMRAPVWYDNKTIIGMRDRDNGEVLTESTIVAKSLSGEEQTLTDTSRIAIYPSVSADGSKIAFNTPNGELYVINIKK